MDLFADAPLTLPDADLRYLPHWLDAPLASAWLLRLEQETPWEQPILRIHGEEHPTPRLVAWYGDPEAAYRYSGQVHRPLPWTALLGEIRERHGNDAVAVYQGNPSVHNYGLMTHSNYFLGLLKTRNRFSATSVDQLPHHLVSQQMYGHGLLIPIPDIDHTDFMLVLGGNPLASNGSIMTVPDVEKRLKALKARGGRLVVVDPRRSETAAIADRHLFIRPGQDAALLLGILNTLFEENLGRPTPLPVDGLERVREAVAVFDAESMSARCGVPAESIRQLARDFAAAERAVCYGRMGVSTQAFGTLCQWLVQLINLVTGNLDQAMYAQLWLAGSLNTRTWSHVVPAALGLLASVPLALYHGRRLEVLELGDASAAQLGVAVERVRLQMVLVAVGMTAIATAAAGPIAFIALAGPQLARRLTHSAGVPLLSGALMGAVLLLAADLLGQRLAYVANLPIGLMTGLLGGFYLLWLLLRSRRI